MTIKLYNSLTQQREIFEPIDGKTVRMYSCGVTVYDQCHIGHARSLYIFDVIRRYLCFRGYDVRFVRNITDVDDKIINRANELGRDSREVSEENIRLYYEDMDRLGVERADVEPKATENIPEMIAHIQGLIKDGYAYEISGDVYFRVRRFAEYGKLSGQSPEKMLEAVRIEKDSKKEDPLDFALWKFAKPKEPAWQSPWGPGRPGWHIECSCMSMKHLQTQTLDIHAGGRDLIFPHHENEIAQSQALTKKPFAKYWIHHGLLTINGQKMSKSLGNFITIKEALDQYPVDDLKIFFLSSAYGSAIDFTSAKMLEAHKINERLDILFWKAARILQGYASAANVDPKVEFVERYQNEFLQAMDDDFNTPQALAALLQLVGETNKLLDEPQMNSQLIAQIDCAVSTIERLGREIFGLFLREPQNQISAEDQDFLNQRAQARRNKDFKRSDDLREVLRQRGIIVEDSKDGQTWRFA